MKKQFYALTSKLALVVVMAFCGISAALAGNYRLVLGDGGDISIKPGETKEIPVTIVTDDKDMYGGQIDFCFTTEKLSVVEGSFRANDQLVSNEHWVITCNKLNIKPGYYRISFMPTITGLKHPIPAGTNAPLAYITIKADQNFTGKNSDNSINYRDAETRVIYDPSVGEGNNKDGSEAYKFVDTETNVVPNAGSLSATEEAFSIKPGTSHKVEIVLNNEIDFTGLSGIIALPEGMTIEKNADDEYVFTRSERLPSPYTIMSADRKGNKVFFAVSGLTTTPFAGKKGEVLFSFNVVANKNFATTDVSAITVSDIEGATWLGAGYELENLVNIKVTSTIVDDNEALMGSINDALLEAQATATAADEKLNGEYSDVKDLYDEKLAGLTSQINGIGVEANSLLASLELTDSIAAVYVDSLNGIRDSINALMAEAEAMHNKVVANEKANDDINAALLDASNTTNEATEKVESECANVKDEYLDQLAEVAKAINDLGLEAAQKYAAIELDSISGKEYTDSLNVLKKKAEDILAAAQEAQKAFVGKNETLMGSINDALLEALATATAADEKLNGEYSDVKNLYDETLAGLTSQINGIGVEADSLLAALELTDSIAAVYVDSLNGIRDSINALMAEAEAMHNKIVANEKANDDINAALLDASNTANEATEKVENECPDVKDEYLDQLAEVTKAINDLGLEAQQKFAAIELDSISGKEYTDSLNTLKKKAEDILAAAQEAQAAHDNQEAYDRLKGELDEAQKLLDETIETIEKDYADVASQFVGVEASIQQELDRLYRELEEAYNNKSLGKDSEKDIQYLLDQIAKLLEDAKKAQTLGIDSYTINNGVERTGIYTLDGKKLSEPIHGQVNIFKYADGTTVKAFFK